MPPCSRSTTPKVQPGLDGGLGWPYLPFHAPGYARNRRSHSPLNCSRSHALDKVGISGLAALLPHEHGDLPAVIDAVKSHVQHHIAEPAPKLLAFGIGVSELSRQVVGCDQAGALAE